MAVKFYEEELGIQSLLTGPSSNNSNSSSNNRLEIMQAFKSMHFQDIARQKTMNTSSSFYKLQITEVTFLRYGISLVTIGSY